MLVRTGKQTIRSKKCTYLQPPPLLVQFVDGSPALAQLVQQVLDLLRQVLVLPADAVQLLGSLVPRSAKAEQLGTLRAKRVTFGPKVDASAFMLRKARKRHCDCVNSQRWEVATGPAVFKLGECTSENPDSLCGLVRPR